MVDRVIFLIYGVTWCVGVTMPIVIFCIYRTFLRWGWVKNYQSIAIYYPFDNEASPLEIMNYLHSKNKEVFLPVIEKESKTLSFAKYGIQFELVKNNFGIFEPKDKEFIRIAIDLMPDEPWDDDTWDKWTSAIKEKTNRKGKELFLPLREAFTGVSQGPEMKKLIQLIGRSKIIERVKL